MRLHQRTFRGQSDWQAIAQLIEADSHFYNPVDFPWRLCSTSLEDHRNGMVWEDENGVVQAFAGLQFPWLTVDYAIHPAVRSQELELEVIGWSEKRLHEIATETKDEFPFNINALSVETERIELLKALGYTCWDSHLVVFNRSLSELPTATIPEGFTIRPLKGASEVEQYAELHRTAFESNTMTTLWRSHTLEAPLYRPELDLIAEAPDGRLAGFCIWWYRPDLKMAQIEPMGVHPDFQHLGLSQAMMAEGMRRAAALGAEKAKVETYSFSHPALKAYEAAGFQVVGQELKFYKEYAG